MAVAIITGSAGLSGPESVKFFCQLGYTVVGIDNDMRGRFFGEGASTRWMRDRLISDVGKFRGHFPNWNYQHSLRETLVEIFQSNTDRLV